MLKLFHRTKCLGIFLAWIGVMMQSCDRNQLGVFQGLTDVGDVRRSGKTSYLADAGIYQVTGGGSNIWNRSDAFTFVWKKMSGDLSLQSEVSWLGIGKHPHRKAGLMIRESLQHDAAYVDAVIHGDGLISMQYRKAQGEPTFEVSSPIKENARLLLERHGAVFSLTLLRDGQAAQPVANISIPLSDSVYVGLAVCAHDDNRSETAQFSRVECVELGKFADDDRAVESTLEVVSVPDGERRIVYRTKEHFEAPNWSWDNRYFLINNKGRLYTIPIQGGSPQELNTGMCVRCNNDHGFSADGKWLAISDSHQGSSQIYVLPAGGGEPRLVTPLSPSYWHGWSPDGKYLTYCASRSDEYDVYAISSMGGRERRLTTTPGLDDGPEYSPDGNYIYFNSVRTGVMKIWRMRPDGSAQEQVTFNEEYADWFPHPSPDGKWLAMISYDKSVSGHPAHKNVVLRIMPAAGDEPTILATLFGGQGTINVPSWSPDSRRLAFVSYRLLGK